MRTDKYDYSTSFRDRKPCNEAIALKDKLISLTHKLTRMLLDYGTTGNRPDGLTVEILALESLQKKMSQLP